MRVIQALTMNLSDYLRKKIGPLKKRTQLLPFCGKHLDSRLEGGILCVMGVALPIHRHDVNVISSFWQGPRVKIYKGGLKTSKSGTLARILPFL